MRDQNLNNLYFYATSFFLFFIIKYQISIHFYFRKRVESEKIFNKNVEIKEKFKFVFIQLFYVTSKSQINMKFKGDDKKKIEKKANEIR